MSIVPPPELISPAVPPLSLVPPLPLVPPLSLVSPASPVTSPPPDPPALVPPVPFETHLAFLQAPPVHGSPSFLAGLLQVPVVMSQDPDSWHSSIGGQPVAVPGMQVPPEHLSFCVHGLPSEQSSPSALVCTHPVALSQLSIVQGLPSSQSSGVPPPHTPLVHF